MYIIKGEELYFIVNPCTQNKKGKKKKGKKKRKELIVQPNHGIKARVSTRNRL